MTWHSPWRLGLTLLLVLAASSAFASPFMLAAPDPLSGPESKAFDAWVADQLASDRKWQREHWVSAYGFHGLLYETLIAPDGLRETGWDKATGRGIIAPLEPRSVSYFRQLCADVVRDPHLGRAFVLLVKQVPLFGRSVPQSQAEIRSFSPSERALLQAIASEARAAVAEPRASNRVKAAASLLAAITGGNDSPDDSLSPEELARIPKLYPHERLPAMASQWYLCYALAWRHRVREAGEVAAQAARRYGADPALRRLGYYSTFEWMAKQARAGTLRHAQLWAPIPPAYGVVEVLVLAHPQPGVGVQEVPKLTMSPGRADPDGVARARYLMPFSLEQNPPEGAVAARLRKHDPRFRYEETGGSNNTELFPGESHTSEDWAGAVPMPVGPPEVYSSSSTRTAAKSSPAGTATLAVQARIRHQAAIRGKEYSSGGSVAGVPPLKLPPRRYQLGQTYVEVYVVSDSETRAKLHFELM